MTPKEVREAITNSKHPDWFREKEEDFNFPHINYKRVIKGVSTIYEFVNSQAKGWEDVLDNTKNIPNELNRSKEYFLEIKNGIEAFLKQIPNLELENLHNVWHSQIHLKIINHHNYVLLFDSSIAKFLLDVHKKYPNAFGYAYEYLLGDLNNKSSFLGKILAYEFQNGESNIIRRSEAEEESIELLKSSFQDYSKRVETEVLETLVNTKNNYQSHIAIIEKLRTENEQLYTTWFENTKTDFEGFDKKTKETIKNKEDAYSNLLSLKKPAEYWEKRANDLKAQGWTAVKWLSVLVILASGMLFSLLWLAPENIYSSFLGQDKSTAIRWSIIFITLVTFLFIGIRALVRIAFSSFHLARDAEERVSLTFVYLALINEGEVEAEERKLVFQSLFSRAETGLLSTDSSPTMPGVGGILENLGK